MFDAVYEKRENMTRVLQVYNTTGLLSYGLDNRMSRIAKETK